MAFTNPAKGLLFSLDYARRVPPLLPGGLFKALYMAVNQLNPPIPLHVLGKGDGLAVAVGHSRGGELHPSRVFNR